jgi:WD40 repeat protein
MKENLMTNRRVLPRYPLLSTSVLLVIFIFVQSLYTSSPAIAQSPQTSSKLAIVGTDSKHSNPTIFMLDPDGKNSVALTNDDVNNLNPVWSPDGTQLAYVSSPGAFGNDHFASLIVLEMGATLKPTVVFKQTQTADDYNIISVTWSPDSSKLFFYSQAKEFHVVNADGSKDQLVTVDPAVTSQNLTALGWTKDGNNLLIEYYNGDHLVAIQTDLDGSNPKEIPDQKNSVALGRRFSPDGNAAFSGASNPLTIFDYTQMKQIKIDGIETDATAYEVAPNAWSPDNKQLAIIGKVDDGYALFTVNADGTNVQKVDTGDIKIDLFRDVSWGFVPSDQVPTVEPTFVSKS